MATKQRVPFQPPAAKTVTTPPSSPAPATEAPPPSATPPRPATRGGKRVVSVFVTPETWKQLRLICIEEQETLQQVMTEAIDALFERRGLARIAADPPAAAE